MVRMEQIVKDIVLALALMVAVSLCSTANAQESPKQSADPDAYKAGGALALGCSLGMTLAENSEMDANGIANCMADCLYMENESLRTGRLEKARIVLATLEQNSPSLAALVRKK